MRPLNRALSTALAATVAAAVVGAAPAGAVTSVPSGQGTTTTTTSVLSLSLGAGGSLLKIGILTDQGQSSTDPASGTPGASNDLVPLTVDSTVAGLHVATPGLHTKAPGGASDIGGSPLTLASLGVPASIATATVNPAALHSDYAPTAAHSNIGAAQIKGLTVAGGSLASIDVLSSNLTADALASQADGLRGVQVGTVKMLNLGALLGGLGTNLTALPLASVLGLVDQLKLPVGLPAGTSLTTEVTNLQTAITGLQSTLATVGSGSTLPANLPPGITNAITGIVPVSAIGAAKTAAALPIPLPTQGTPVAQVTALLGQLQGTLAGLLSTAVPALDSFPLVQLSATSVGITTKAADTVANSAAGVTVLPVKLTVAGLPLNLDLAGTVNTVNSTISAADDALNGLLTGIGLPKNLVSLDLLQQAHSVSLKNGYTLASAGVSVATLKIAAVDPAAIVAGITKLGGAPVSSVLSQLGIAAGSPLAAALASTNAMSALKTALGQAAPLTGGAELRIASLSGASTYTVAPSAAPPAAGPTTPVHTSLPHTGGNLALALLGVVLALLAMGGVRWARSARALPMER